MNTKFYNIYKTNVSSEFQRPCLIRFFLFYRSTREANVVMDVMALNIYNEDNLEKGENHINFQRLEAGR